MKRVLATSTLFFTPVGAFAHAQPVAHTPTDHVAFWIAGGVALAACLWRAAHR